MVADELRDAERAALVAESKAVDTLNKELRKHRASAEHSLAEARALLARREAALDAERANVAVLDQALAQTRLELEVALERQRLAPTRLPTSTRRRRPVIRPNTASPSRAKASRKSQTRRKSPRVSNAPKQGKRKGGLNRRRIRPKLKQRK